MSEFKVSKEVAEIELNDFAVGMDLDWNVDEMSEEDLSAFNKTKRLLVKQIQSGHLSFNDNSEAVYTPHRPSSTYTDALTFHERSGETLMNTDSRKKGQDAAKMYVMMGQMCKVHSSTFTKLVGTDIKVCEALFSLLMD